MKRKYFRSQVRFRLTERKKLLPKISSRSICEATQGWEVKAAAPTFRELKTRKQQVAQSSERSRDSISSSLDCRLQHREAASGQDGREAEQAARKAWGVYGAWVRLRRELFLGRWGDSIQKQRHPMFFIVISPVKNMFYITMQYTRTKTFNLIKIWCIWCFYFL